MKCNLCGIEFDGRKDAKYCSSKCRKIASRINSVTDNVTLNDPDVTLNFKFTVTYNRKPGDPGYDPDVAKQRQEVRTAKYWYDVPLAAVPIMQKDWPVMPDWMNGRQYFLWWKNEFQTGEKGPVIHNPFPVLDNVHYEQAGEGSRRWGA